jgi:uncharacterized protein
MTQQSAADSNVTAHRADPALGHYQGSGGWNAPSHVRLELTRKRSAVQVHAVRPRVRAEVAEVCYVPPACQNERMQAAFHSYSRRAEQRTDLCSGTSQSVPSDLLSSRSGRSRSASDSPVCTGTMREKAMVVQCRGAQLDAVLTRPQSKCRAAVTLLHPADDRSRQQFLFEHLAMVLPAHGIAVFRYDRRTWHPGRDVPYELQAEDLGHGLQALAEEVGPVPIGLWGFSQGAWVAVITAAARADIAFLVLIGCSAVSPGRQMQYGTAEQLRRAGFGPGCVAELAELREAYQKYQRGQLSRQQAQEVVDTFADRPWFELSWVPRMLPETPDWDDMDFDPAPCISKIRCPVLAFYGADEWIPVQESISIWQATFADLTKLTIHELAGSTHHPTLGGQRELAAINPEYSTTLTSWLDTTVARRPIGR